MSEAQEALQKEKSKTFDAFNQRVVIRDRFISGGESWEAAEMIVDQLAHNGGLFLFDKYL